MVKYIFKELYLNNTSKLIFSTICILFLSAGCQKSKPLLFEIGEIFDKDHDGYNSSMDCNDNNPYIYPGAPELANDNADNNCNSIVDEPEVIEFNDLNLKKIIIQNLSPIKGEEEDIHNFEINLRRSV